MVNFKPAESGVTKHYRFYNDNDRHQIQNEVMAHWDVRVESITIEGDRYSKMYHPADVLAAMLDNLTDAEVAYPPEFESYSNIQKWVKKWVRDHILTHSTVHVPHLQAKRKWGKPSGIIAYQGRHGFTGMERRTMYCVMSDFYTEVTKTG